VSFDPDRVEVAYGDITVCRDGVAAPHDGAALAAYMGGRKLAIRCDLRLGAGRGVILTNDLSPGYIDENMRTS
ncbi:MAG TPA: bifunctional ornithine acetyltransferase/N-acetylglutamate synthase, partial [Acidimicrobiales bacterium]